MRSKHFALGSEQSLDQYGFFDDAEPEISVLDVAPEFPSDDTAWFLPKK